MSFFTSLLYFRPQPPPRIKTRELASVVKSLYSTANVQSDILSGIRVKFGRSIDKDTKNTVSEEETAPGVFKLNSIEFDINHDAKTCEAMIAELMESDSIVYRAEIQFGCAKDTIRKLFQRKNSPENEVDLSLTDLRLEIGPIHAQMIGEDASRHVGWIALTLSGQGNLFPWTRAEILKRAAQSAELQELAQICSDAWPIDPHPLKRITNVRNLLARTRKTVATQDVNTLTGWQWDVRETS